MPVSPSAEEGLRLRLGKTNRPYKVSGYWHYECPACTKQFHVFDARQWSYRLRTKGRILTFCSYPCMRKAERAEEPKKGTVNPIWPGEGCRRA